MIKGIYETHVQVSNLENAIQFYTEVLGLKLAHRDETRPIAFLWVGDGKEFMLGLWEQKENLQTRHFAFSSSKEDILNYSVEFLKKKDLKLQNLSKGWKLVNYQDQHLGWINVLANRINNYYPKELRILKDI